MEISLKTQGDDYNYNANHREQFAGYVTRYGPGMVIYWFGFIEELQEHDHAVLLVSYMPREIIKLDVSNKTE